MHPSYEIAREYAVRLLGTPDEHQWRQLLDGVELEDGKAAFDSIEPAGGTGANVWVHVTLREGRNREVRRIFEAVGLAVSRLIRIRYGPVSLGRMRRGSSRKLERQEVAELYAAVRLEAPATPRAPHRKTLQGKASQRKKGRHR